jgi:hypothetical protein
MRNRLCTTVVLYKERSQARVKGEIVAVKLMHHSFQGRDLAVHVA